jgi:hypothetical protein
MTRAPEAACEGGNALAWSLQFVTLPDGKRIRYSWIDRGDRNCLSVRFIDVDGRKVKRATGETAKHRAIEQAHRIILEAYKVKAPTSETITWETAKEMLREAMAADGKRPRTVGGAPPAGGG